MIFCVWKDIMLWVFYTCVPRWFETKGISSIGSTRDEKRSEMWCIQNTLVICHSLDIFSSGWSNWSNRHHPQPLKIGSPHSGGYVKFTPKYITVYEIHNITFITLNALNEIYGSKCIEQNEIRNMKYKMKCMQY